MLASGKTTASKIISYRKGPLFSADSVVRNLYYKNKFKKKVSNKLGFKFNKNFRQELKKKVTNDRKSLKKLERIIHPLVRKKMFIFLKKNKKRKFVFLEIPLLIESKLMKHFDKIIFINSKKKIRLKRYKSKGGETKIFNFLDKQQFSDKKKIQFCDHIVVNNKSLSILKKKLSNIIKLYE